MLSVLTFGFPTDMKRVKKQMSNLATKGEVETMHRKMDNIEELLTQLLANKTKKSGKAGVPSFLPTGE